MSSVGPPKTVQLSFPFLPASVCCCCCCCSANSKALTKAALSSGCNSCSQDGQGRPPFLGPGVPISARQSKAPNNSLDASGQAQRICRRELHIMTLPSDNAATSRKYSERREHPSQVVSVELLGRAPPGAPLRSPPGGPPRGKNTASNHRERELNQKTKKEKERCAWFQRRKAS